MSTGSNTVLADYRTEKARESIKAARIMLNEKMLTFAMNRIYYAMFYAVQAALSKKGVSFSKHSQVKGYFNREFIKSVAPTRFTTPWALDSSKVSTGKEWSSN